MKVGIQLYSVRNEMKKNPLESIRKVANLGYKYIEFANHTADIEHGIGFNVPAKEVRKILDDCGAVSIGTHTEPLTPELIKPLLEYQLEIGSKYIAMPLDFYKDRDEILRKSEALNIIGEKCNEAGIHLVYHNHYHEFQVFPGEVDTIFDILLENTDPSLVSVELDTYWTMRGGVDPIDFIKKYGKRIKLIHQKDFSKNMDHKINLIDVVNKENIAVDKPYFLSKSDPTTTTEIGKGIMDIQGIIDATNEYTQSEYVILEQDASLLDEFESIKVSMENFKKMNGISWE